LRRTAFAVTCDAKRFTINGILLLIENSQLKMVSTDGHRLCYFRMGVGASVGEDMSNLQSLIPIKAVRELMKILAEEIRTNAKAEVKIRKGGQLEFEIGSKLMTARELTGNFPNWEMVLPKDFDYFAELKVNRLKEALTRVSVMADDSNRRVEFVFFHDRVSLKTESAEAGSSAEEVSCTFQSLGRSASEGSVAGSCETGWRIAFNTKYLSDFFSIQGVKSDDHRVVWKFTGTAGQSEMSLEGEEKLFSYILVPLKS
jgi:DNA polymerase III subunit beta